MNTHEILEESVRVGASDIHMAVGRPPTFRLHGSLKTFSDELLTPEATDAFVKDLATERHLKILNEKGGADFSYVLDDKYMFRVSIFKQSKKMGAVLRLIPDNKMTIEDVGLGEEIIQLLYKPRGLILLTGPTGSGKSTTLAAMIDFINSNRECNIITVEDPIEYRHVHKKSIIVQREVGEDVETFEDAIVKAMRQDPDIILVGEMRNQETIGAAIRAAETGHLVFSTLHTTGAARTVDRIVDVFPANHRDEIRTQLAGNLVCVISQQLMKKRTGGRIAAHEVMITTPAISAYIRENKTHQIISDLQTGAKFGMYTMDSSLFKLYLDEVITYKDMMNSCYDKKLINKLLTDYAAADIKKK